MVAGIDLSDREIQISYSGNLEKGVNTYSVSPGEENFGIPAVAIRNPDSGDWFFGEEALALAEAYSLPAVGRILMRALKREKVEDMLGEMDCVKLLGLFLDWALHLPDELRGARFSALAITVRTVHRELPQILNEALSAVEMHIPIVRFLSYAESFFSYSMSQPIELWRNGVVLFDYGLDHFEVRQVVLDNRTRPIIATTEEDQFPEMLPFNGRDREQLDEMLLAVAKRKLNDSHISSVYLMGKAFSERWETETLRYICKLARVFQGQNLYSKGACYAAADAASWSHMGSRYLFLDDDSIRTNICIRAIVEGKEVLLPVIDAGVNWYNAEGAKEVLLGREKEVLVVLKDMSDGNERNVVLRLDWMPDRPERASRVRLSFRFTDRNVLEVKIKDLGFGDFFPATGLKNTEVIRL